jgi:ribosomal protein S11
VIAVRPGDGRLEVDVHGAAEATSAVLRALLAAGVTVTAINPVGSTLEDVFLRVTGQPLEQSA